jgi:hypothetical protein
MSSRHYLDAVEAAAGVELPREPAPAPLTPWGAALTAAFDAYRAVVHEERVMDAVLTAHASDKVPRTSPLSPRAAPPGR